MVRGGRPPHHDPHLPQTIAEMPETYPVNTMARTPSDPVAVSRRIDGS